MEREAQETEPAAEACECGGSGAGVNIEPVAFLVVSNGIVKLLPVTHDSYVDKLIDYVPDLLDKSGDFIKNLKDKNKCIEKLKEKIEENIKEDTADAISENDE